MDYSYDSDETNESAAGSKAGDPATEIVKEPTPLTGSVFFYEHLFFLSSELFYRRLAFLRTTSVATLFCVGIGDWWVRPSILGTGAALVCCKASL
jgi:hypothetical protein